MYVFHLAARSLYSLKGVREKQKFRETKTCQVIITTILKRYTSETRQSIEKRMEDRLKQYPSKKDGTNMSQRKRGMISNLWVWIWLIGHPCEKIKGPGLLDMCYIKAQVLLPTTGPLYLHCCSTSTITIIKTNH